MPKAGAAFHRPASWRAWPCGVFSKDKQRTPALGDRMLLQCTAPVNGHGTTPQLRRDLRPTLTAGPHRNLERLICCTAVGTHVDLRRSVQRFERNTYHGDALPTELTGPIFSYLTWGFMLPGHPAGRAHRSYSVESSTSARPHHTPPALESLAHFHRPGVSTCRRPTCPRGRYGLHRGRSALRGVPGPPGHAHRRGQRPPGAP